MKKLSLQEVERIAHQLAKRLMDFDEPLPAFGTRYPGKLESCIDQPFQTFGGNDLYPRLVDKAAVLFYLIIKNHPFANGNKRMAVTTTLVFLFKNNYWLEMTPDELYRFALEIAKSKAKDKESNIEKIETVFEKYLVKN